ncbi:MAG: glycosyltransferase family A protein [Gammaproteobacteria bacterium]|nr:glycosyltransferase family A protein [Gammaproteobacteria bacterium]
MPTISAIITTFNRCHYLKKAIESVLSQTYQDFELLILDNSSTDQTETVVNQFNDQRIRYIKHPQLNISQTRNLGVKESRGEFIAFLDDDDMWLPNKLTDEYELFNASSKQVALVYGGFVRIDSNDKPFYRHQPYLQGKVLKSLLLLEDDFTGSASNPMLRKSAVLVLGGFDEAVKTGEDWEFYLRLAEQYEVALIPQPVVNVRHHHGARLGDKLRDYIDLELQVMCRYSGLFNADKKLRSFYLQRIGGKFVRLGLIKEGRQYLLQSLKANHHNSLAFIQLLSSYFGKAFYQRLHQFYLNCKRPFKV